MHGTNKVSDLALEQFVLGELAAADHARITQMLRTDGELQIRFAALQRSNTALRAAYPGDVVSRAILRRAEAHARVGLGWRWPSWLGLALTAALVLVLVVPSVWQHHAPQQERLKGDEANFVIERLRADGMPQALLSGDHGDPGDVLQIAIHPPLPAYVMVVSIDGGGHVTQLVPQAGATQQALATAGIAGPYLPVTYTLDHAPHFERVFLVGADASFSIAPVMGAAAQLAADIDAKNLALPLSTGLSQTSILILKD